MYYKQSIFVNQMLCNSQIDYLISKKTYRISEIFIRLLLHLDNIEYQIFKNRIQQYTITDDLGLNNTVMSHLIKT